MYHQGQAAQNDRLYYS